MNARLVGLPLILASLLAPAAQAETPSVCKGIDTLGTFRILVRPTSVGVALPLKSLSGVPPGAHFIWDPVRLADKRTQSPEVAAIVAPETGDQLVVLDPRPADAPAEWEMPIRPAAIAIVYGPQGLSVDKVKLLATQNRQVVDQLAGYAEQTSKVEAMVQELSNAERSGVGMDAALKGVSTRFGVAMPKLDPKASTDQQATVLLQTLLPSAATFDPLATRSSQVQQSTGLAAAIAGMFFGNAVGLAAGGTALIENIHGIMFPGVEFKSAFAQSEAHDSLAICAKSPAPKARIRFAYLWAYRLPNVKTPKSTLQNPTDVALGLKSTLTLKFADPAVKSLGVARDWRLVAVSGNTSVPIPVQPGNDDLTLDLTKVSAPPGDYRLAASWDWGDLAFDGTVHLRPLPDLKHAQLTAANADRLIEGSGRVHVELSGTNFEFLEKVTVSKADAHPPSSTEIPFTLPHGPRDSEQTTVGVDLDTATRGAYILTLTQTGGATHQVAFTVHPPNPTLTLLPLKTNLGEVRQAVRFEGTHLDRIESVTTPAGDLQGAVNGPTWAGTLHLKNEAHAGESYPLAVKVRGITTPLSIPDAVKVLGPRPRITGLRPSAPAPLSVALKPNELPSGTPQSFALTYTQAEPSGDSTSDSALQVELACKSGSQRKALRLTRDDHVAGARLSAPAAGLLYLTVDPGAVGYTGCQLTAAVEVEPEGRSDAFAVGRVVRVPQITEFALSNEQVAPSTFAGEIKGRDLDIIERVGWDARHGTHVEGIPSPVSGEPLLQSLRVTLPWPAPAPHAPLYVWLRGEEEGRRTTVSY